MNAKEYYASILSTIKECFFIISSNVTFDEIDENICYLKGILEFIDGSTLHFIEFADLSKEAKRLKYKYHWQGKDKTLIARWDNVPHHNVKTFPHHKHDKKGVHPSRPADLEYVLEQITEKL